VEKLRPDTGPGADADVTRVVCGATGAAETDRAIADSSAAGLFGRVTIAHQTQCLSIPFIKEKDIYPHPVVGLFLLRSKTPALECYSLRTES
jgi:hypothetical protein